MVGSARLATSAAWILALAAACSPASSAKPRDTSIGLDAVERAVKQHLPGAGLTGPAWDVEYSRAKEQGLPTPPPVRPGRPGSFFERLPGLGASGNGAVFGSLTRAARSDWTALVETAPHGVPGLIVDQAEAVARSLLEAGFVPLDTGATVWNLSNAADEFSVHVVPGESKSVPSPHAPSAWSSPRDPERVIHRRIYHTLGTGAFILARIEYERPLHLATVEIAYVEATAKDGEYERTSWPRFHETVSPIAKPR